ncbi:MAG: histidine phosphatase family protein [Rudaea sp.]|nr:histidine phosphatase family protein [Rudaea sp.]
MADQNRSSRLWLVRHAQASFGSANYDVLSERGQEQAQRLAAWLVAHPELKFARVAGGTLRRHAQTLAAIERAFKDSDRPLPAATLDPDWNEFDHEAVIRAYASRHPDAPIVAAARGMDHRAVHALLAAALHAWANGELDGAVPETWEAFGVRVARARARLDAAPQGKILVVSSGGPITRCAQAALGCDAARAVRLNLALRNTAISEFRGSDGDWQMHIWNMLPHLPSATDREWVTYY